MSLKPPAIGFDSTLALLREGYAFMPRRFARVGGDAFRTRLGLTPVTCLRGRLAAREFYAAEGLSRKGAAPPSVATLLQDYGSVQMLDGAAHRRRKRLFVEILRPPTPDAVRSLFAETWRRRAAREAGREIALLDFAALVLTETALRWLGLDAAEPQVARRCAEMRAMVEGAAGIGLSQLRAQALRARSERWARATLARRPAPEGPVAAILAHRDADGAPLPLRTAAVELLNLIRPIVAVAWFVADAGHALQTVDGLRERVRGGSEALRESVANEVRRFYPFFPVVAARATRALAVAGRALEPGDRVALDVFGCNRHPLDWTDPDVFRPDRFRSLDWRMSPIAAQGTGDERTGHRCPGEALTVALLTEAVGLLATGPFEAAGEAPPVRLDRMPAAPEGGLRLRVGAAG